MTEQPQQPVTDLYAIFSGSLDQYIVNRLFNVFALAHQGRVPHVHLLLHSNGGGAAEGVCLYNFFKALPLELTVYNIGQVCSAATVAYLGAKRRKVSAHAAFLIHRVSITGQFQNLDRLQAHATSMVIDDMRTEAILRKHLDMPEDRWATHQLGDLWLSAAEAVKYKLADEIGEFQIPASAPLVTVFPAA